MASMFEGCESLKTIPLYDTSKVNNVASMFRSCFDVSAGILDMYNQLSTQTNVPRHSNTFQNCGRDSGTGAAELAQIPSDWK